jgi:O-antigen/teichoic acid export membrane protein
MILNTLANIGGRFASLALTLIFLPIFLKLFGAENFGLIAISASIFFILPILDAGFGTTLNRLTAQAINAPSGLGEISRALKSFQTAVGGMALCIAVASPLIGYCVATVWVIPKSIPTSTVSICITLTIISAALRLFSTSHTGVLMGAEKQVFMNLITTAGSFIRTAGTAFIAIFWPDVTAYFICLFIESAFFAICTYQKAWRLVGGCHTEVAKYNILKKHAGFFGFMALNTGLLTLMSQLDRLLASGILTLDQLGLYGIAATLAAAAISISYPVAVAALPRFTRLLASDKLLAVQQLHYEIQLVIICVFAPACGLLFVYADSILIAYLGQQTASEQVAPFLRQLSLSIFANSLLSTTYNLAVAGGRVKGLLIANLVAIIFSFSAILIGNKIFGAKGVAIAVSAVASCHLILIFFIARKEIGYDKILYLLLIAGVIFLLCRFAALGIEAQTKLSLWALPLVSIFASFCLVIIFPVTRRMMLGILRRRPTRSSLDAR